MTIPIPFRAAFLVCATAALALAAGPAFAHAKLLSETPVAEDAASALPNTAPVTELRLNFSEELNSAFSRATVTDATGKLVDGVTIAVDAKDGKVLVVSFAAPLPKGEYTVDWTAVASDGHKSTGSYKVNVAQ